MPIPDVNAWWTQQQQRLPGLGALPSLAGAGGAAGWESVAPQRSALYDLYQQDMGTQAQAAPAQQGEGQAPAVGGGLPEGGSALGQMLASLVGASRTSTTPLAGLPSAIGDTQYSYAQAPAAAGAGSYVMGGTAPPGMFWNEQTQQMEGIPPPQTGEGAAGSGGEPTDGGTGGTPPADGEPPPPADTSEWYWGGYGPTAQGPAPGTVQTGTDGKPWVWVGGNIYEGGHWEPQG